MSNAEFIIAHPKSLDKIEALKSFLKALKIDFEINSVLEIPVEHKKLVRKRVLNSKPENLLDWDSVKNDFDGI